MFIIASTSYKSVQCALLPIVLIELKVGGAETELVHLSTRPIVMQNVQRFPFSFEDDPHFFTFIGAPILIVFTPVLWQLSVLAKKALRQFVPLAKLVKNSVGVRDQDIAHSVRVTKKTHLDHFFTSSKTLYSKMSLKP